jgi:hypothetical protein
VLLRIVLTFTKTSVKSKGGMLVSDGVVVLLTVENKTNSSLKNKGSKRLVTPYY